MKVEHIRNKIDIEFCLDIKEECFEEREKNTEAKEIEAELNMKERDKEAISEILEGAIEYEESDDIFENDNEDLLHEIFDGE